MGRRWGRERAFWRRNEGKLLGNVYIHLTSIRDKYHSARLASLLR